MTIRRCIYDRISERRLAEEEKQRLADAAYPKGDFTSTCFSIVQSWVWLPGGSFETPLPAGELANAHRDFSHDPRLLDSRGLRQPVRRLATGAGAVAEVKALDRCGRILQVALEKWAPAFRSAVDWPNTQVVLFIPDAVLASDWYVRVLRHWPPGLLPQRGFEMQTQPPTQWVPEVLANSAGAKFLLCLSVGTWACIEQMAACRPGEVAGEAASAVLLCRQSKGPQPQTESLLKLCAPIQLQHNVHAWTQILEQLMAQFRERTGIDPARVSTLISDGSLDGQRLSELGQYVRDFLPQLNLQQQISLDARFGPVAEQWAQIGLAWLVASAQPDCAAWILQRTVPDQTQGWLIGRVNKDQQTGSLGSEFNH
jgi:hypothetical protein